MMKFALFLVCALVAVQGFQARSVHSGERDLNDIIDAIKAAIAKIKEIVSNVAGQIPEIIQNIKDKINEIVGKLPEIIEQIRKKIEEIVQNAGEIGRKCVEPQKDAIEALVKLAQDGIRGCIEEADSKADALRDQLQVLVDKVLDLEESVVQGTLKCVNDNKLNPAGLVKCLSSVVDTALAKIFELQGEIDTTINVAKETAQEVSAALSECTAKVQQEVAAKEEEIINAIKECIASSS